MIIRDKGRVSLGGDANSEKVNIDRSLNDEHSKRQATNRLAIQRARRRRRGIVLTARASFVVAVLGLWQLFAASKITSVTFTSEPSRIAIDLWSFVRDGKSLALIGVTLYETFMGFIIAAALGLIAGYMLYRSRLLADIMRPFITAGNAVPKVALAPLFVLWFGLGSLSRVVLVISLVFFIMTINTFAGLQNCERDLLLLGKSLGASRITLLMTFVIPSAIPTIFAGLQLGLTYAFIAAVVGEMLSGNGGIGAQMSLSLASYRTGEFFAGLFVLVVMAVGASTILGISERYLLRWRGSETRDLA